jgi:hypothetical protein
MNERRSLIGGERRSLIGGASDTDAEQVAKKPVLYPVL